MCEDPLPDEHPHHLSALLATGAVSVVVAAVRRHPDNARAAAMAAELIRVLAASGDAAAIHSLCAAGAPQLLADVLAWWPLSGEDEDDHHSALARHRALAALLEMAQAADAATLPQLACAVPQLALALRNHAVDGEYFNCSDPRSLQPSSGAFVALVHISGAGPAAVAAMEAAHVAGAALDGEVWEGIAGECDRTGSGKTEEQLQFERERLQLLRRMASESTNMASAACGPTEFLRAERALREAADEETVQLACKLLLRIATPAMKSDCVTARPFWAKRELAAVCSSSRVVSEFSALTRGLLAAVFLRLWPDSRRHSGERCVELIAALRTQALASTPHGLKAAAAAGSGAGGARSAGAGASAGAAESASDEECLALFGAALASAVTSADCRFRLQLVLIGAVPALVAALQACCSGATASAGDLACTLLQSLVDLADVAFVWSEAYVQLAADAAVSAVCWHQKSAAVSTVACEL